eukprot:2139923-Rhodomonas_salina.1
MRVPASSYRDAVREAGAVLMSGTGTEPGCAVCEDPYCCYCSEMKEKDSEGELSEKGLAELADALL